MTYGDYYELWNEYYGDDDCYGVDLAVAMNDMLELQGKGSDIDDNEGIMASLALESF
jgi:hypothetical protein